MFEETSRYGQSPNIQHASSLPEHMSQMASTVPNAFTSLPAILPPQTMVTIKIYLSDNVQSSTPPKHKASLCPMWLLAPHNLWPLQANFVLLLTVDNKLHITSKIRLQVIHTQPIQKHWCSAYLYTYITNITSAVWCLPGYPHTLLTE